MTQASTKRRNIIIASTIIVVLVVSSVATLIIVYPSLIAKHKPTELIVNVSINQTNVYQGDSLQAEVNVKSIGNSENVTLSYSADSIGIGCSFDPGIGTSNFTSTITMNVPDSTPSGNYTIIVTASADGAKENTAYVISVFSPNELSSTVTVSGTVDAGGFLGFGVRLNQIEFVDNKTNSVTLVNLPSNYSNENQDPVSGTYSVILQNEHTYHVIVTVIIGPINQEATPYTFDEGNLYVYAAAGNTTIQGQNFSCNY